LFKSALTFEILLPRGEGIDIFDQFNTATFMSMLQTRIWISFLRSMIWCERWLFVLLILAGFISRVTRRISLVEQERITLPEHLSSPPVFSGVRFARSFVLCVLLGRCLSVCLFSSGHCVVCLSSISGFLYYPVGISKLFLMNTPGSTFIHKIDINHGCH
jgi:hypothetical protein